MNAINGQNQQVFPYLMGKSIVVVGGTSGIGLAICRALYVSGADVTTLGLDEDSCHSAATLLGDQSKIIQGDATNEKTVEDLIAAARDTRGKIDGLVHVAGGSGRKFGDGPLHELNLEAWEKTLRLNLTSVMLSNQKVIRYFLAQGNGGTILNISSVLAFAPSPHYFTTHAYATAKAGIIGLSQSLAAHYSTHNIRINVLAPGLTLTPMAQRAAQNSDIQHFTKTKQPLDHGRMALPEDMTGLACYCMSDLSGFTTGQVFSVDGGWSLNDGQFPQTHES